MRAMTDLEEGDTVRVATAPVALIHYLGKQGRVEIVQSTATMDRVKVDFGRKPSDYLWFGAEDLELV